MKYGVTSYTFASYPAMAGFITASDVSFIIDDRWMLMVTVVTI